MVITDWNVCRYCGRTHPRARCVETEKANPPNYAEPKPAMPALKTR